MSKHTELLKSSNQSQVLRFWDDLSDAEKEALDIQIEELDKRVGILKLRDIVKETEAQVEKDKAGGSVIEPPTEVGDTSDEELKEKWNKMGLTAIAKGQCAAVVMAGGQGTRLGSSFPKGIMGDKEVPGADFGLPSKKSLFQLHCERIQKLQKLAQSHENSDTLPKITFLVMTSDATHDTTESFFQAHSFFGLDKSQVIFFKQGRMPALDENGCILMSSKSSMCMSPDGNGGIYNGLCQSGSLDILEKRGVKWVQVFSVDNLLIKVADPVFFGYCQDVGVSAAAKTVSKVEPSEKVGVFALRNGKPGVIEYSEIGDDRAAKRCGKTGKLLFNHANIAIHSYSLDFLKQIQGLDLSWHIAKKTIKTVDGDVSGMKLEGFIFDAFAECKKFGLLQCERRCEFAPIKNADGAPRDTPSTALDLLSALHKSWLSGAGVSVPDSKVVEVSPLISYAGEDLKGVTPDVSTDKVHVA
eukprot:TRINITY_DN797_c4_g1_i1.p1 TRINITY_DN797_c4_g1~~TRINITY_DN797_c4_g1_i1.p1  ORF type:complete len:494 (+),score=87.71 TRINITY_DN797_c4_g1_i1:74-1483(+)